MQVDPNRVFLLHSAEDVLIVRLWAHRLSVLAVVALLVPRWDALDVLLGST